MSAAVLVAVLLSLYCAPSTAVRLDSYNVDRSSLSVSGISAGAAMATQFHVAHSSIVMGVGLVAGMPYMCSGGSLATATTTCMVTPSSISISSLVSSTNSAANINNIDATSNMQNDRVWIFAGTRDTVVNPVAGEKTREYYANYVNQNNIKTVFNLAAEHSMPTSSFGGRCDTLNSDYYINNCSYDAAFEILNHIYGDRLSPPTEARGSFIQYDQGDFFYYASPSFYSMDDSGFVYVPTGCASKTTSCKLHVAFHGCLQGMYRIGDVYARHAGYNEVGEANNIIILYPQAKNSLMNPNGCWDWWGYSSYYFATKLGYQITAVYRMIQRVMGA